MRISISEQLRPFSHLPGTSVILPGWGCQVEVFPCLIRFYDLKMAIPILIKELRLDLKGPIQQFTVCNDLEKGRITISGITADGWIRYHLISSQNHEGGIRLLAEKVPLGGFPIYQEQEQHLLHDKEWIDILGKNSFFEPYQTPPCDRLSLGNHKAQDWEFVKRRLNLTEILPFWHRLGQLIPPVTSQGVNERALLLLEACRRSFIEEKPEDAQQIWLNLFRGGFKSLLIPQIEDSDYQGLIPQQPLVSLNISPLILLVEGARLIRHLFFQQEKDKIAILPYLLPALPCGRLLDVSLEGGGSLSLEWTKKTIRCLILSSEHDQELSFKFRSHVRSYRLRQSTTDKGKRISCDQTSLFLKKNTRYFFDNFQ
jgi:hypothetical protein